MEITYYCHSSFLMKAKDGTKILTDPCAPTTGYTMQDIECDAITSSHAHFDHNYFVAAKGEPKIFSTEGTFSIGHIKMKSYPTYHDENKGADRGNNLIFVYEIDGMKVVHLGDLGDMPSDEIFEDIGKADVVFAPVGGIFTMDPKDIMKVVERMETNIMIPMHYKTPSVQFELGELDDALCLSKNSDIQRLNGSSCIITKEIAEGKKRITVFDPLIEK